MVHWSLSYTHRARPCVHYEQEKFLFKNVKKRERNWPLFVWNRNEAEQNRIG